MFSVSATTRAQRPGERDGVDYYFVSREKFEDLIGSGALIEYEEIFGNYYGTPISEVERAKEMGKRGRLAVERKYSWERNSEPYRAYFGLGSRVSE